jgi:nucleotide-binding universal stress UspA family protein
MATELRTILVGTDFSPEADGAIQHAIAIARRQGARLVLVHASPVGPTQLGDAGIGARGDAYRQIAGWELEQNRTELEALATRYAGAGVAVSTMIVEGHPGEAMCAAAAEAAGDLVVVGSHGRTGIARFLLGSVAEHVARACAGNVLVARAPIPAADGYRRILVPIDFSPESEQAIAFAVQLAAPDAAVRLVFCWEMPMFEQSPVAGKAAKLEADIERDVRARGEALVAKYARPGLTLEFEELRGSARSGIQSRLETGRYELAIVGRHGAQGIRRFLLGSVAEATVRHSPCSVLITAGRKQ